MKTDDLHPFVLPYVPGLPLPTVDHHLRIAANEFLRRTLLWQVELDPITIRDGQWLYELDIPAGAVGVKLLSVLVAGDDYAMVAAYRPEETTLRLTALPAPGMKAVVKMALAPEVGELGQAWTVPDEFKPYRKQIAFGAIASLKTLAGDLGESDRFSARFEDAIATHSMTAARAYGRMRPGRYAAAQFY